MLVNSEERIVNSEERIVNSDSSPHYSLFTIHYSLKKGFTLIEIIISLIISAMIGVYILKANQKGNFTSDVSKFASTLVAMIESGVTDSTVGYVNGSGGDCSVDNSYTDISAQRVNDCVGWKNYTIGGTTPSNVGTDNYLEGINLLGAYTSDGKGCKVYFDEDTNDTQIFYIFVDCSNLNYDGGSARYKKYVEDRIGFTLESSLSTMHQATDQNATSLTTSGGDGEDGMIKVEFKK